MGNFFSDLSNEEGDYDNLEEPEPVKRKTRQTKYVDDYDYDDDDELEKEYEREYVPVTKSKTRRRKGGAKNKSKANRRY